MQNITKLLSTAFMLLITTCSFAQQDSSKTKDLHEVIITGQYKPQSLKASVYQVRVINSQRIKLSGATTVQQVLNTQLGFRFLNDNLLATTDLKLNGIGGNRVKILLDGVPMIDRYDERASLGQVDINNIERIEIVEGPMSVSYGSDALAGVINIITKKNTSNDLSINARMQEETAGSEYYPFSYQGGHNQNVNINYRNNHIIAALGGTHNDFDGFGGDDYGRGKTWKPKEQWLGNVKLGYTNARFNIYYRLDGMNEKIVVRNPINFSNYKAIDQKYITDRYIHQLQGEYKFNSNLQWSGFIAYTDYKRKTETRKHDFEKGTDELTTGPGEQDLSKLSSISFKNTLQYQLSSKISLQPGIDINHEKASGSRISGTPQINDYALFVSAEIKPTAKINIRPGLRFTKNSEYDAPPVIPSINTKFVLNKNLDLRLSYGYGFRAPTLRELYLTFVDANHNLVGNPDLKAEYSNSINASLNWSAAVGKGVRLTSTLSTFYNVFKNQIDLLQSTTNNLEYTYYNIDKAKTIGGSIDNKLLWKNLEASLGFLYSGYSSTLYDDKTYIKEDNRDLLWTPEINTAITYNIKKIRTMVAVYYKYIGKKPQFSFGTIGTQDAILLTKTDAYNLADLSITTTINKYISTSVGVKNIFDVTNVNSNTVSSSTGAHSSSGPQSIGYGRSFFLGINLQWSKK